MTAQQSSNTLDAEKTLRIERTFDAPRDLVYQAWTDPVHMTKWWGPEGMSIPNCEIDVQPGGAWRTCMLGEDQSEHWVQGTYQEVDPPEKLVFTWAWEDDGVPGHQSTVTIEFHDRGDQTNLILIHQELETTESRDMHGQGWSSSFNCLTDYLTR